MHACEGFVSYLQCKLGQTLDRQFRPVATELPPHGCLDVSAKEGAARELEFVAGQVNKCPRVVWDANQSSRD